MKFTTALIFFSLIAIGCESNKKDTPTKAASTKDTVVNKKFSQIKIKADYKTPTVGIDSFTLITNDPEAQIEDAKAIMRAKVIMPLAMQKHDAALFDSILAKDFTGRGENEFLEREAYIQDRIKGKWMISDVQYENIALQFFGEIALLTYRNIVKEKDAMGLPQTWHYTWADIWIKEDGRWKIKAFHAIHGKE